MDRGRVSLSRVDYPYRRPPGIGPLYVIGPAGIEDDLHGASALFVDLALQLPAVEIEDEAPGHLSLDLVLLVPDRAPARELGPGVAPDLQRGFPRRRASFASRAHRRCCVPFPRRSVTGPRLGTSSGSRHGVARPRHRASFIS